MKFSLSWLREHLETQASLDSITTCLSAIGLEVEGVENKAAALSPFVTALVIEAVQHPNADRLRACRVDVGDGVERLVVCGAPNARTGLHAVFAPPGAVIPGSGITLKVGEIRGVKSEGMLVSFRELALGEEHDGIIELPDDSPVGASYAAWAGLDDPVIEIGVTPNRGDALSVRGIARDLAAAGLGTLKPWAPAQARGGFASPIVWRNEAPSDCMWVLGRLIRGVRNGPSPDWLKRRLTSIGLRPISALVDITNFLTHDIGRPLHVFDADRIAGGALTLRRGNGETFRTLAGRDLTVTDEDLVIADAEGVQSLAGIIGGEATGSTEATANVFVECALFDPVRIALSGRRHTISTDARQRFERSVDQALLPAGLDAATALILDLCGGEASEVTFAGAEPSWQRTATLRFSRLASLGGSGIGEDEAVDILQSLGFGKIAAELGRITVAVPSWRNDIAGASGLDAHAGLPADRVAALAASAAEMEQECDLIEEVLRIKGLDDIAAVSLPGRPPVPLATLTPRQSRTAMVRRLLAARGMAECVTYSFAARSEAALFGAVPEALTLKNPIASDLDQMRPSPLATLAQAVRRNAARGVPEIALFEIGPAYGEHGQTLVCAGLQAGAPARHWQGAAEAPDAMLAKAHVLAVLGACGVAAESLSVTADAAPHYHPGRSGVVRQGPKAVLAHFGALHPSVLAALDLDMPVCGFEIMLDAVADPKRRRRAPPALAAFQPVRRDFAFVVKTSVGAETVLRAARSALRSLVEDVRLFDVFTGGGLADDEKSLGIEVVLQPREHTLTDAEIESACASIVAAVTKAAGARLR
jgi:phenylalanyl-tRNA synthetase beta chain